MPNAYVDQYISFSWFCNDCEAAEWGIGSPFDAQAAADRHNEECEVHPEEDDD